MLWMVLVSSSSSAPPAPSPVEFVRPSGPINPMSATMATAYGVQSPAARAVVNEYVGIVLHPKQLV